VGRTGEGLEEREIRLDLIELCYIHTKNNLVAKNKHKEMVEQNKRVEGGCHEVGFSCRLLTHNTLSFKSLTWFPAPHKLSMMGHSCNPSTPKMVDQEDQEFGAILSYIVNLRLCWAV